MATFLEGVESISLPCTLIILLPLGALVLTTAAGRVATVVTYASGASLLMWARAGRLWEIESTGVVVVFITAVIVVAFAIAATTASGTVRRAGVAGVLAGAIAGWLWEPCVGAQFGEILNNAETDRGWTLVMMHVYVAGTLLPALLLAVVPHVAHNARDLMSHRRVRFVGLGLGFVYAATVASGRYDDLVGELFRISAT